MAAVARKQQVEEVGYWERGPEERVQSVGRNGKCQQKLLSPELTWVKTGERVVSEKTYRVTEVPARGRARRRTCR
jgi:hypothetical protein